MYIYYMYFCSMKSIKSTTYFTIMGNSTPSFVLFQAVIMRGCTELEPSISLFPCFDIVLAFRYLQMSAICKDLWPFVQKIRTGMFNYCHFLHMG